LSVENNKNSAKSYSINNENMNTAPDIKDKIYDTNYDKNDCPSISDEAFYSDKRYFKIQDRVNSLLEENIKIKEEHRELKMVVEVMKNYLKIQEVIF
jgi:hypothetical protein